MSTILELTAQIVSKHAAKTSMSTEQLLQDMHLIHAALKQIEEGGSSDQPEQQREESPTLTIKQAFKKNEVICMVCNKGGFKTLGRHLSTVHNLKPGQYRKQFGIKSTQKLAAKSFSEARSKAAIDRGMVDILANAREKRMANIEAKKNVPAVKKKSATPQVKTKASAPAVKVKADAPVVKKKAPVPAVRVKADVPVKVKGQKVEK
jgi:predicted transcriptional regulator